MPGSARPCRPTGRRSGTRSAAASGSRRPAARPRHLAVAVAEAVPDRLQVDRLRVVDLRVHSVRDQVRLQRVAPLGPDDVRRVGRLAALLYDRRQLHCRVQRGQRLVEIGRRRPPPLQRLRQPRITGSPPRPAATRAARSRRTSPRRPARQPWLRSSRNRSSRCWNWVRQMPPSPQTLSI